MNNYSTEPTSEKSKLNSIICSKGEISLNFPYCKRNFVNNLPLKGIESELHDIIRKGSTSCCNARGDRTSPSGEETVM